MRVFRPTRKDRAGKSQPYAKWYVEFRDHLETIRRLPGFTDKRQTEALGRNVEKLVASKANGGAPDKSLAEWLESMPLRIRKKLADVGLLDRERMAAGKPLTEHLDDFEKSLLAKGNTEKHARLVANRTRKLMTGCRFSQWSEISASRVEQYLADLRDGEEDVSRQTSNFYLAAAKQFCKWMMRDKRASTSPLDHLRGLNVKTDRRHDRRALVLEELRWLLDVTAAGPERRGVSGYERYITYRLAVETGLRASEIRSLKRSSFDFRTTPATVTVEAGYSKRRREDVLPLRNDTAELLKAHLASKMPEATALRITDSDKTATVIRADLADARTQWLETAPGDAQRAEMEQSSFLLYRDDAGLVADFHALRHTFITNLANSGVHPKTAQQLARHSTIDLTMNRYTHSLLEDLGEAVAGLPELNTPAREAAAATGTHGRIASPAGDPNSVALCVALNGAEEGNRVQSDAVKASSSAGNRGDVSPDKTRGNVEKQSGWDRIRTCGGLSPSAVFKTAAFDHSATHPVWGNSSRTWLADANVPW